MNWMKSKAKQPANVNLAVEPVPHNYNYVQFKTIHERRKEISRQTVSYLVVISLAILFFMIGSYYNFPNHHFNHAYSAVNLKIEFEMTVAGFGLGVVGGALQATTRNDLAGPTTLGFIPAIILGIYTPIIIAGKSNSPFFESVGARFLFGILFAFLLVLVNFVLTRRSNNAKNNYVPLLVGFSVGVAISVACVILGNYYVSVQNSGYVTMGVWGGIQKINANIQGIEYGIPLVLAPTIIILFLTRYLNVVDKDPIVAKAMGVNVNAVYWVIGILSVIIVAASMLMVGSILLLAIVAPHLTRKLFKTANYKMILPFSGILCAMLLNLSYLVTQADTLIGINLVPILFCAPIFIVLLRKKG